MRVVYKSVKDRLLELTLKLARNKEMEMVEKIVLAKDEMQRLRCELSDSPEFRGQYVGDKKIVIYGILVEEE